jgi:hypothetical protein
LQINTIESLHLKHSFSLQSKDPFLNEMFCIYPTALQHQQMSSLERLELLERLQRDLRRRKPVSEPEMRFAGRNLGPRVVLPGRKPTGRKMQRKQMPRFGFGLLYLIDHIFI